MSVLPHLFSLLGTAVLGFLFGLGFWLAEVVLTPLSKRASKES